MALSTSHEVLITTGTSEQSWSACAWDILTGSSIRTFKGVTVGRRGLCVQANHTIIGASATKPFLQLWGLTKREDNQQKIVCPGKVTSLAVSFDGLYCVASIAEKLYVWEMNTGGLLAVLVGHYLTVTVIRFTDDGNYFVTGSDDGIVSAWSLADVISTTVSSATGPKPWHKWSAHPLAIKDIHVGCGGALARVISCSIDQTCKMWDINSGELMQTFVHEDEVHSVTMDKLELRLFAGLKNGDICSTPLYAQQWQKEHHPSSANTDSDQMVLKGHMDVVTCLSVSFDGSLLVSGSADNTVKVWNIFSGRLNYTLDHKGQVTNILLVLMDAPKYRISHQRPVPSFMQQLVSQQEKKVDRVFNLDIQNISQSSCCGVKRDYSRLLTSTEIPKEETVQKKDKKEAINQTNLVQELARLKQINQDMYTFITKNIVKPS
ncbi:hypothetical protein C0Q70_17048 [Pomacea canaliculata]|uniref:Uncharacterized protein n=1 Tax=Pomacea canaliculata TaxID=400727 RepID=A0A2T7NRH5_POMCA|nr:WD repeat-containing protein 18-like [Pomacea canaliculata]PVD23774.1 hypothetical protein C0Q70_17048 [Pomacea canaliculata]